MLLQTLRLTLYLFYPKPTTSLPLTIIRRLIHPINILLVIAGLSLEVLVVGVALVVIFTGVTQQGLVHQRGGAAELRLLGAVGRGRR